MTLSPKEQALLAVAATSAEPRPTRWCAITGAPGSGKTTLVQQLASEGWPVIEDPGRAILNQNIARGIEVERSGAGYMRLQEEILERELAEIARTDTTQRVFFDYGIAESLAFMKLSGLPWPTQFINAAAALQFERVFLLAPLSLKGLHDGVRVETKAQRHQLWGLIGEVYRGLGMHVIDVPNGELPLRLSTIYTELR